MRSTNNCELCGDNKLKKSAYCQYCEGITNIDSESKTRKHGLIVPIHRKKTLTAIIVLSISVLVMLILSSIFETSRKILFRQQGVSGTNIKRFLFGILCILLIGGLLFKWNKSKQETESEKETKDETANTQQENETVAGEDIPELELTQPVEEERELGEVFHVSDKSYTYNEARAICKKYGAELSTPSQVYKMYTAGTSWCEPGWSEGQHVIFPSTQQSVDEANSNEETKGSCGKVGLNGMFERDTDKKYGVNCWREGVNYPKDTDSSGI